MTLRICATLGRASEPVHISLPATLQVSSATYSLAGIPVLQDDPGLGSDGLGSVQGNKN